MFNDYAFEVHTNSKSISALRNECKDLKHRLYAIEAHLKIYIVATDPYTCVKRPKGE